MLKCRQKWFLLLLIWISLGNLYLQTAQAQNTELDKANRAYELQDYEQSVAITERILAQDSLNLSAYQLLAVSNLALMKYGDAEHVATRGLHHFPESNELIWFKSEALLQNGKLAEALSGYQTLLGTSSQISQQNIRLRLGTVYQMLAGQYYLQDNFELAAQNLMDAKTYMPDSVSSYSNLALVYAKQEKWKKALNVVNEGRDLFPENDELLKLSISLLYENKDYDAVLDEYADLYSHNPENIDNAIAYGELLLARGQTEKSEMVYDDLFKKYPKEKRIYKSLARFFSARGDTKAQRGVLRKMQRQFPKDAGTLQEIAGTYVVEKEWEYARAAYDSAVTFGGNTTEIAIKKADTYLKQDSLSAAQLVYEHALLKSHEQPQLLWLKGINEENQNQLEQALNTYKTLTKVENTAEAFESVGLIYTKLNNNKDAQHYFEEAAYRNSESAGVYYHLSRLYMKEKREKDSFKMSVKSLKLALTNLSRLQQNLAETLQQQNMLAGLGESEKLAGGLEKNNSIAEDIFKFFTTQFSKEAVLPELEQLLEEYPLSGRLHFMISTYYLKKDLQEEGIYLLKESVNLSPNMSEAQLVLGNHYSHDGQISKAILTFERALSADPENATAYRKIIELHRENGTLNQLCDRWITLLRVKPNQPVLKEFLIEALHKAGRFEEATEIIQSGRKKAS